MQPQAPLKQAKEKQRERPKKSIQILKAIVRKITIVKQFMRRAYGNIDISTRIDEPKRVYSTSVSEML